MPDRPWTELMALYPEGHPVRSAIRWADMDSVPVLAGVLVEEIERLERQKLEWQMKAHDLANDNERLRDEVERLSLLLIEATNPGIDMEKVKTSRAADV